jgi:magnesium-transporting ATPase (P-type)
MVSYRDMSLEEFLDLKNDNKEFKSPRDRVTLEHNLTALAIFGLQDPLRPGIYESVKTC